MYAVPGASGQLGSLVIEALFAETESGQIVALVRDSALTGRPTTPLPTLVANALK